MERVRSFSTLLNYPYSPYPHQHATHAYVAVGVGCLSFISSDYMLTFIEDLHDNIKWLLMYLGLFVFFYFFSSPLFRKRNKPSYSNLSKCYGAWLAVAALYHLPRFQSLGVDLRMNLSMFLTIYISSILFLLVFHLIFLGLWYMGIVAHLAGKRPSFWTIIYYCAFISVACCVAYSQCGNRAIIIGPRERKNTGWFLFVDGLKDQMCSSWFIPVGSASDYPLLSKWVIYVELACNGSCGEFADGISPIYSLWATFIGFYIANYVVERSTGWALTHSVPVEENVEPMNEQRKPDFMNMVPWYSGTSADLFKTVFDLLVSVTVFLGRFDMRMMQASMRPTQDATHQGDAFHYDHFSEREDFWFDFMADTGDGGNSSYSVARLLAQPQITRIIDGSERCLLRGNLLLIGGDLAYPNPSASTYKERFFRPFEYALQPPQLYEDAHIATKKPELPEGVDNIEQYDGPQCFLIPGNHDWFDGLNTFMRYICRRSWLGGWLMPQQKSYFAIQLPKGWWIFGLDQALHNDIDVDQFMFFESISETVGENDSVIIMTHEPSWLLDWYGEHTTGENVSYLIRNRLRGRCKLRIAGDLHHYMRHSSTSSDESAYVQHLLVNGGGGAFMHPTHVFGNFKEFKGTTYEMGAAYPSFEDSSRIALGNILKFRKKNWQFDFIGGIIYFLLAFSMFPQCDLNHILRANTISGHVTSFFGTVWGSFIYVLDHSYISLAAAIILMILTTYLVPSKVSLKRRVLIGLLHVSAHLASALILMLLLELGVELCIRHKLLATSGYHTLYEWYRQVEGKHFPDPTGLRARIQQWTFGLYPACIKYLMSAFDVPEVMAVTRTNICKHGMQSLSRGVTLIYYASVFLYFWVFSTPVVSLVFGSYLYICVNWLHLHFDEAFSSLRYANYKSFTRFHIKPDGNLEVFTLGVDKVPKEWKLDPNWVEEESKQEQMSRQERMSHLREHPSRWCAEIADQDPLVTVKIVDHFEINRTENNDLNQNGATNS